MIAQNLSPTLFAAPVADVLERLYSVGCVAELYRNCYLPVSKAPAPEKPKKSAMVAALAGLLADPDLLRGFCLRMPPVLQKALLILAWAESRPLIDFEKEIGTEIVQIVTGPPRRAGDYRSPDVKVEQVELFDLILIENLHPYWSSTGPSKTSATVRLPPAMRKFFKQGLPAPAHAEIIALEEWCGEGDSTNFYDAAGFLAEDLRGLGDGFRRGNIKRNKNGSLAKSCLNDFRKLVPGEEFFPESGDDLSDLRLHLLVEFFNRNGNPLCPPENLTAESLAGFLRDTSAALVESESFVVREILRHLRPDSPGADPGFQKNPFCRLLALFSGLPEGRWVTAENLVAFRMYRELDLMFFNARKYSARQIRKAGTEQQYYYHHHGNRNWISTTNERELVIDPMIRGMAFLLAALGMLEICYNEPAGHSEWQLTERHYLTPFDGLEAVRLTPIGAFAFGHRKDLALAVHEKPKCEVHPHPDRLLVRATLPDPLTQKVLREFMEEIGPGLYRLDRTRFLRGCWNPDGIRARVEDFKRRFPAALPPFWEEYLEGLTREGLALRPELHCTIYALGDSPELARLFAADPELRDSCLRVEGRRVAIPNDEFPTVRKRLLKAGYYV